MAGISVDPPSRNSSMVHKLMLPFPLLSDARGEVARRYGLWNEEENVAVPAIVVVDRSGEIRYVYAGNDFADRPGDEEVFAALDATRGSGGYDGKGPEVRLSGREAADGSVRPDRPAMELGQLIPYYNGAFFTTIALKKRFGEMGRSGRAAVREVGRYQKMVQEYGESIRRTAELQRGR